jgi:hypothetical protein
MTIELKMPESNRSDAGIPKAILYTQTIGNINATAGIKPRTKKVAEDQTKDKLKGAIVVKKVMDKKKFKLAIGVKLSPPQLLNRRIPEFLKEQALGERRSIEMMKTVLSPSLQSFFGGANQLQQYDLDFKAISALCRYLGAAFDDPDIKKSTATQSTLLAFLDMAEACIAGDDGNIVQSRIGKVAISKKASLQAKNKNSEERNWVQSEWINRTDTGQSKAAFARQHTHLVKKNFNLQITEDTIKRDWLAKL